MSKQKNKSVVLRVQECMCCLYIRDRYTSEINCIKLSTEDWDKFREWAFGEIKGGYFAMSNSIYPGCPLPDWEEEE